MEPIVDAQRKLFTRPPHFQLHFFFFTLEFLEEPKLGHFIKRWAAMLVLAMHLLQNIAELMGSFRATER